MSFLKEIDLPKRPSKLKDDRGPVIVTSAIPCRYFRGLVSHLNEKNGVKEFSTELLIPKTDKDLMKNILDGIESTVDFQLKAAKPKNVKEKKAIATIRKNYDLCKQRFLAGESNEEEFEVNGEEEVLPNGLFSISNSKGLQFHWPIRDGDLVRKTVEKDDDVTSELECEQEIGRGGELKGCWLVRIKVAEVGKTRDGKTYDQRPAVVSRSKVALTEEDLEEFASLDVGRFVFKLFCYMDLTDAAGGVSAYWKSAQHLYKTKYRVVTGGGEDYSEEFEDEEFEDEEPESEEDQAEEEDESWV